MGTPTAAFSKQDKIDLQALVHGINRELAAIKKNALKIGKLLARINSRKLYLITHPTLPAFVAHVFAKSKSWAYNLMAWAGDPLLSTIVENESQARELLGEDPEMQADVLRSAGMHPTALSLRAELERRKKLIDSAEQDALRDRPSLERPSRTTQDGIAQVIGLLNKCMKIIGQIRLDVSEPEPWEDTIRKGIEVSGRQVPVDRTGKMAA